MSLDSPGVANWKSIEAEELAADNLLKTSISVGRFCRVNCKFFDDLLQFTGGPSRWNSFMISKVLQAFTVDPDPDSEEKADKTVLVDTSEAKKGKRIPADPSRLQRFVPQYDAGMKAFMDERYNLSILASSIPEKLHALRVRLRFKSNMKAILPSRLHSLVDSISPYVKFSTSVASGMLFSWLF